jgi:hypothetical protein
MKNKLDLDTQPNNQPYLFGNDEIDKSNIRVRPAEFARLIDCSKQAVSIWVKDGKITLGTDGRLNPSVAIAQLLKNSNPSLLRAKALKPLIRIINEQAEKIKLLEEDMISLKEDCDFHEGASLDLIGMLNKVESQLVLELENLTEKPMKDFMNAFINWLNDLREYGDQDLLIASYFPKETHAL